MSRLLPILAASGAVLLLGACSLVPKPTPDPTRFFLLEDPVPVMETGLIESSGHVLGLLPTELPSYLLDQRAIAITDARNAVKFRDFDRWAEPLDEGVTRVLRTALVRQESVAQVFVPPYPLQPERAFNLQVRVIECAGTTTETVRFAATYSLTAADGELYQQGNYIFNGDEWDGRSETLADEISRAVADLAAEIASHLP